MRERIVTCLAVGIALSMTVGLFLRSRPEAVVPWAVPRNGGWTPRSAGRVGEQQHDAPRTAQAVCRARHDDRRRTGGSEEAAAKELMDGGDAFFVDELVFAALEGKGEIHFGDTQTGNYDQTWLSERVFDNRTSLILDPPDGRTRPPAPGLGRAGAGTSRGGGKGAAQPIACRICSSAPGACTFGTPNLRGGYQSYFAISQGPDAVAMRMEMIHDARVFPIDGRPARSGRDQAISGRLARATGKATRSSWTRRTSRRRRTFAGATDGLHLVEKLTPRRPRTPLGYYVTIDDPTVWSRPWTAMIPLKRTGEEMF